MEVYGECDVGVRSSLLWYYMWDDVCVWWYIREILWLIWVMWWIWEILWVCYVYIYVFMHVVWLDLYYDICDVDMGNVMDMMYLWRVWLWFIYGIWLRLCDDIWVGCLRLSWCWVCVCDGLGMCWVWLVECWHPIRALL